MGEWLSERARGFSESRAFFVEFGPCPEVSQTMKRPVPGMMPLSRVDDGVLEIT